MSQPLSLKIGPFGVRGVIGESLTPQLVTSFAAAFGTYAGAGPILVATDTRHSAEMVKQAAIAGLLSVGCTPIDLAIVPVPTLMLHVREAGAFGGLYVGGSDSSPEWSALKFVSPEGLSLRPNQAAELTDLYHQGVFPRVRALEMADVRSDATSASRHVAAIARAVDVDRIRAHRYTVAVDPRGGAARSVTRHLLEALGCRVAVVDGGADGSFVARPELEESDLADLRALVRASGADIGFAQDADGDRLVIVDEAGCSLEPDMALVLVAQGWHTRAIAGAAQSSPGLSEAQMRPVEGRHAERAEQRDCVTGVAQGSALAPASVVASASTSRMIDDVAAELRCRVCRSRAGEASVLETMLQCGADVGGESDGGVIVRPINPCRDSFAAMAVILDSMAANGKPVSALRARVPRYSMIREQLLCPGRDIAPSLRLIRTVFAGERFDLTDGVKISWNDRWLLARPAPTEPGLVLAAEAPSETDARSLLDRALEILSPGA